MTENQQGSGVGSIEGKSGLIPGHPAGLPVLFFTELWERFSYYGMRAILVLYMTETAARGGLGMDVKNSSDIFGNYTASVYLASIVGGLIADRFLGARLAVLVGGVIIALGHFTMAIPSLISFYAGLALIILGTGFLKPNISTMVGKLYKPDDNRRDAGFSIFYMGINIGAMLSPLACGYLAQSEHFKQVLKSLGLAPEMSWHFGFAAAGVGMCIGLAHLIFQYKLLDGIGEKLSARQIETSTVTENQEQGGSKWQLTESEWHKVGAIACLFVFNLLFWSIFEQGGSSLNLFAERLTEKNILGFRVEASYLQAVQALDVIILAPLFSLLWVKLGRRQPSSPAKFALGLMFLGLGIAIMVPAAMLSSHGLVSPYFLIGVYFVETLGEMCLSPVGLSTVSKLAPRAFQSMTMGAWFISTALGNKLAGVFSGYFKEDPQSLIYLFGGMAVAALAASAVLFLLTPTIKKLMGEIK
ncbi:MAG: peptide MFS transporter [Candidatus Obscuribacterales bacterium]|nr:peptide MFS transporter [Candidatus Obscuribacterales bacterium]